MPRLWEKSTRTILGNFIFRPQIEKCKQFYCYSDFDPKIEKHYVRVAALPPAGQISEKNGARPDLGTSRALKYCK